MFHRLLTLFLLLGASTLCAEPLTKEPRAIPSPVTSGTLLQWFVGLVIVLAIIIGCSWFLRRFANLTARAGGGLKVLGGVSVGTREKVLLLQAGKKQLVIGVAPGQIRTLYVLEEGDIANDLNSAKSENGSENSFPSFSEHLKQIVGKEK